MILAFLRKLRQLFRGRPVEPIVPRFKVDDVIVFNGRVNTYEAVVLGFEDDRLAVKIVHKGGPQDEGANIDDRFIFSPISGEWKSIVKIRQVSQKDSNENQRQNLQTTYHCGQGPNLPSLSN